MKWKSLVKIWVMFTSLYIIFIEVFVYSNSLIQEKRRTLTWFISYNYSNWLEFIFNKILKSKLPGVRREGLICFFIKCLEFYSWDFAILPVMLFTCIYFQYISLQIFTNYYLCKPTKSLIGLSIEEKSGMLITTNIVF